MIHLPWSRSTALNCPVKNNRNSIKSFFTRVHFKFADGLISDIFHTGQILQAVRDDDHPCIGDDGDC